MGQMIGKIAYKLSFYDLHIKYKEQILGFYKALISHKDETNVLSGVFNLPCFHQLYKDICSPPKRCIPGTAATQSTNITTV